MVEQVRKTPLRVNYDAIAERANVSKTTVSLVLRGLARDRIPASTYSRVEDASRELGYYPNRLVQALQKGRTETLAVIAPALDLEHAGQILEGIRGEAASHGYAVMLGSASENATAERVSAERLLERRADGLIRFSGVADRGQAPDWLAEAVERGVPCVVIDDVALEGLIDCVVSDDEEGAYQSVVHLLSLGRQRIAHFAGDPGRTSAEEREGGYRRALRESKVAYERVVGRSFCGEGLLDILPRLFEEPNPPDALFCCGDVVALRAQEWLTLNGFRIPEDVALVGFSNSSLAGGANVSSVEQPFHEMGACAVRRLLARIEGDAAPYVNHRLPTTLVVRNSTAGASLPDEAS